MQANTSLTLSLPPLTPGSPDQPLGLAAATSLGIDVTDTDAILHRVLLPANVDTANTFYGVDLNGYDYHNFPGLTRTAASVPVRDWADLPIEFATLRLLAIDVRPLYPLTDIRATGVLTSNGTNVTAGDTVTIDGKTYTFRTTLTPAEGEVLRSTTADLSLLNLIYAINHTGTPGTHYSCAAAHPSVSAEPTISLHQLRVQSLIASTTSNLIPVVESAATLTWSVATLSGSEDPGPRDLNGRVRVEIGNSLAPGSSTFVGHINLIFDDPGLFTLALPAGWVPGPTGFIRVSFTDTDESVPTLVNAACTLILIGTRA